MSAAKSSKPIMAVDIDEVLCDFIPALVRFHNDLYKTALTVEDFHSYSFNEVWGGTVAETQEKMSLFFNSSYFLIELKPTARAQEVTKALKEQYDLHVVTSRQHKLEEITRGWIRKHYPNTFTEIHFGNHYCEPGQKSIPKSELCQAINAILLIDDNMSYAVDCSDNHIPVVLFGDYAWNRQEIPQKNSPLVRRAFNWGDVPTAIQRALSARTSPSKSPSKSQRKKIVIAVDVDEVLASFSQSLLNFYNEKFNKCYGVGDMHSMRFNEVWGITVEETNALMDEFHESPHFLEDLLPVDEQAFHHLGVLREKYELHVVTARKNQVEGITRSWIDRHYPNIFTEIHFGNHYITEAEVAAYKARGQHHLSIKRSKSEMCKSIGASLLIDDNMDYALDCAREGIHAILFGNYAWNRGGMEEGLTRFITRVNDWSAVDIAIESILDPLSPHIHPAATFYKPVVAVDIDEVLASFLSAMVTHYNEENGTSYTAKDVDEQSATCPILSGTDEEKTIQIDNFLASSHFRDGLLPVEETAFHHLGVMRERYELHVVTARKMCIEDVTRSWIEQHYPNIFTEVHFGNHYLTADEIEVFKSEGKSSHAKRRHKSEICTSIGAGLLIDDNISYALECAEKGIHVILFGNYSWNKGYIRPDLAEFITRVDTWAGVEAAVDEVVTKRRSEAAQNNNTGIIAAVQMCSGNDKTHNREVCAHLISEAARNGAQLVCLPECCSFMGRNSIETLGAAEDLSLPKYRQPLSAVELIRHNNESSEASKIQTVQFFREIAVRNNVWLSLGGIQELRPDLEFNKISNAHVIISPDGTVKAIYRKIHLFDAPSANLCESNTTAPGVEPIVVDMGFAKVGLSVCYDLRFPEMYAHLRNELGADILLVPAAFTVRTGAAHWEILLRSRAIENQCVVVAAAQYGCHNERRTSYGHTMIVDAWGEVAAELPSYQPQSQRREFGADTSVGSVSRHSNEVSTCADLFEDHICYFEFSREKLRKIRTGMPVEDHHKYELFVQSKH